MIPNNVKNYMDKLIGNGYEAYIVGGAVRDTILHKIPKDWDIFTNATGEQIQEIFSDGKVIGNEERQKKILTVVVDGVEISAYRKSGDRTEIGNTLEEHLKTCDYTCNSIAMDRDEKIIDPLFGMIDLVNKPMMIKAVGNPKERMDEDALRAFRGIRFSAKYDCGIDPPTFDAIRNTNVENLPPERIRDELLEIFKYRRGLELLDFSGMLKRIWPEFDGMHGMDGGHHHNETVWVHTNIVYQKSCDLTDNVMLHITSALHDIGKPTCMNIKKGKINFIGHEQKGSKIAENMLTRLKFSKQDIDYITTLIKHHLFGISGEPKIDKGYRRLYVDLERISEKENTPYPNMVEDLTSLFYCDYQGNLANKREKFADYLKDGTHRGTKIIRNYYILKNKHKPFTISDIKVKGGDVINLGIAPGKRVGQLLKEIFNLTIDGILRNERHEQMFWLREQIKLENEIIERRKNHGK